MTKAKPIICGGIGLPVIDNYAPSLQELRSGAELLRKTIAEAATYPPAPDGVNRTIRQFLTEGGEVRQAPLDAVLQAVEARNKLSDYLHVHRYKGGDKIKLQGEELQRVQQWFNCMRAGVGVLNDLYAIYGMHDRQIQIRHAGGTNANKLTAIHQALEDLVEARLFGVIGRNDLLGNRTFLEQNTGVTFEHPPEAWLEDAVQSYVILTADRDRVILKAPAPQLGALLAPYAADMAMFLGRLDTVLVEGSDMGQGKFGFELFQELFAPILDSASAHPRSIIFAAPTDTDLVIPGKQDGEAVARQRALLERIIDHPGTGLMTMNESEAVAMFLAEPLSAAERMRGGQSTQLRRALDSIQQRLHTRPVQSVEPLAVISVGRHGAFAVTAGAVEFQPAPPADIIIDTTGAGDGFAAGCIIQRRRWIEGLRSHADGPLLYDSAALARILEKGQQVAHAVIGQKGAQLPAREMQAIFPLKEMR